jgi:hypothetical protein
MAASSLTAVAAEVVAAVAATPDPTAVAKAAPRAATVTKDAAEPRRNDGARGRKTIAISIATVSARARFTTAVAGAGVAMTAAPETTAVAKAAPRAAPVTAHATELPRNDGARGRGRAGVTAKTIAFAIAATWVAVATLTTTVAAGETANRQIANARHRTETTAFARAPSVIAAA